LLRLLCHPRQGASDSHAPDGDSPEARHPAAAPAQGAQQDEEARRRGCSASPDGDGVQATREDPEVVDSRFCGGDRDGNLHHLLVVFNPALAGYVKVLTL